MSVHVTVRLGADYLTESTSRGHRWTADLPPSEAGGDAGPTPEEMLLGALGSCTAMTLRLYATRKGWPLAGVEVELSHALLSREDCADCPPGSVEPKVDRITRRVRVEGDLTDEQIRRLLDIAEKCPVHRILTRHPVVVTDIARASG